MLKKKKYRPTGFTLIELLVAVLIIGILTAIALPQYKKAVGKAELAQVVSATKAIQNAQERYYLVQGEYTNNLQNLDIDLPNNNVSCSVQTNYSKCNNKNYIIAHYYALPANANRFECYAKTQNMLFACEELLGHKGSYHTSGPCTNFGTSSCWDVVGEFPM